MIGSLPGEDRNETILCANLFTVTTPINPAIEAGKYVIEIQPVFHIQRYLNVEIDGDGLSKDSKQPAPDIFANHQNQVNDAEYHGYDFQKGSNIHNTKVNQFRPQADDVLEIYSYF